MLLLHWELIFFTSVRLVFAVMCFRYVYLESEERGRVLKSEFYSNSVIPQVLQFYELIHLQIKYIC